MAEENNIGASRLLGTNGLQQAVDSLSAQVGRLSTDVTKLIGSMSGLTSSTNRSTGSSGTNWNGGSNRNNYSANGGGGVFANLANTFTNRARATGTANGGGSSFGSLGAGSRLSAGLGAGFGVASSLVNYGNRTMSSNMQMDFYGSQQAILGGVGAGGFQQANAAARAVAFNNNYLGTSPTDMAQAAYINNYTFGAAAQNNGMANPSFVSGMRQVNGFGYTSPTLGASGAATAAQQTYAGRSFYMLQALGYKSPIGAGGVKNSMGSIAQSIMARSLKPGARYTTSNIAAALGQGGGLGTSLDFIAAQAGWNSQTEQEYKDYITGQVAAQSRGISASKYDTLTQQAANGNKGAISQLQKVGVGSSMYEIQRNLNSTQTTRQNDILNSLSPAFDNATKVVNQFSQALTSFLQTTGLDKLIGGGAGTLTPVSNALGGMSNGLGTGLGLYGAARLFRGAGGGTGLLGNLFGRGATASSGLGAMGADGAYGITTVGAGTAATGAGALGGLAAGATLGSALLAGQTTQNTMNKIANKNGAQTSTLEKAILDWEDKKSGFFGKQPSTADRKAFIASWFQANPSASVDPKVLKMFGYTAPVTSGQSGGGASGSVKGNAVSNGSSNTGANAASIIKFAETQLGVPYVWGGESPGKGMDCSGLTQWAYSQAGVKIPRVAADQQKTGTSVATNKTQPGDLLFQGNPAHHVVMAIGGGKIIEAPHTGENVRIRSLSPGEWDSATRIVGSIGDMGSLANSSTTTASTLNSSQNTSGGNIGSYGGTSELEALMGALSGSASHLGSLPLTSSSQSAGSTSGTAATGSAPNGNGNNSRASLQAYAKTLLSKYGWAGQWNSFNALEMSEAGWDYKATNPTSGAYGLPQSLPASKMSSAGADWKTNGDTQLVWMMDYIKGRYGSPDNAWSFHQKNNWYASGAWSIDQDQAAQVHKGEMILPAKQAETVRQAITNAITNSSSSGSKSGHSISFGNINVTMPAGYTGSTAEAQQVGKTIVNTITEDNRIKKLQMGQ